MWPRQSRKSKGYKERGNPNTCPRKEAKRERERENHLGGARPPNLLNISLCGLASSCLHPCLFCLRLGQTNRHFPKKQTNRHYPKRVTNKRCQTGANKHVKHTKKQTNMLLSKRGCPRRNNVGLD